MKEEIKVYTDGASRGNPGHSGASFVIFNSKNKIIKKFSKYLGVRTNNAAEYSALLFAHKWLLENIEFLNITSVIFYLDSELVVKQMRGEYKIKNRTLLVLSLQIKRIDKDLGCSVIYKHIRREKNSLADILANKAIDQNL